MFTPNQFTWDDGVTHWGLQLYRDGESFLCYQHKCGDWFILRHPKSCEVNWFKKYGKKSLIRPQDEIKEPVELVSTPMPLIKSTSKEAVGKNIKTEMKAGKKKSQAVAIALSTQRRSKKGAKINKSKGK